MTCRQPIGFGAPSSPYGKINAKTPLSSRMAEEMRERSYFYGNIENGGIGITEAPRQNL